MSNEVASAVKTFLYQWFRTFPNLREKLGSNEEEALQGMIESWTDLLGDLSSDVILQAGRQALAHQAYPGMPTPGEVRSEAYEIMGTTKTQYLEDRRHARKREREQDQLDRQLAGEGEPDGWRDGQMAPIAENLTPYLPEGEVTNGDSKSDERSLDHDPECRCDECEADRERVAAQKERALKQLEEGRHGEPVAN